MCISAPCVLTFSLRLDQFVPRVNVKHDLFDQLQDRGLAQCYTSLTPYPGRTKPCTASTSFLSCQEILLRLSYLLKILHDEDDEDASHTASTSSPRFAIIANGQLVLWVTKNFLNPLSSPFATEWFSRSMKVKERKDAVSHLRQQIAAVRFFLRSSNARLNRSIHMISWLVIVMELPLDLQRLFEDSGTIRPHGRKNSRSLAPFPRPRFQSLEADL
ncbi:hypothetical protein BDV11DRAFT_18194 [Aspergillus similis]